MVKIRNGPLASDLKTKKKCKTESEIYEPRHCNEKKNMDIFFAKNKKNITFGIISILNFNVSFKTFLDDKNIEDPR